MKGKNNPNVMKTLNEYAAGHRHLITLGRILAAVSAFVGLIPFYDLWRIIRIAVKGEELSQIKWVAWQAVGLTIAALAIYIAALMCTHIAAFRVQANMRSSLMRRILTLPLGVFDEDGTGKIRRIVNESTAATETFIALEQVKKQTFIAQGYILRVVRDDCLYQQAGYVDINSYAKGELGLGKGDGRVDSIVNRYINVNKRFSIGGYSAVIEDKYMHYSYSALSEIWTMTDEEIEDAGITETTTVAKIREIKRENREDEPEEQIPGQTEITDFIPDPAMTSQENEMEQIPENRINQLEEGNRDIELFREFTCEYYKNYMDREQHALIDAGNEKGFTAYTKEMNYMLLDSQFDENKCIMGNIEVTFNFSGIISLRRTGTDDGWVVRKISDIWMSLMVMKDMKKITDSYYLGERKDANGNSAYERMINRLARALLNAMAQEGEDIPESEDDIKNRVFYDREIDFFCGDMEYNAVFDKCGGFFTIGRYKRATREMEAADLMEIEQFDVGNELMKLVGLQRKATCTLQQMEEIEEQLMENIMDCLECESDTTVDEIMSGEKEFYEYLLEDIGDNPQFYSCYQMGIQEKTYFYYVSGNEIQVVEKGRFREENNVAKIAVASLYEKIKGFLKNDNPALTSQEKEMEKIPENRINQLEEGHLQEESHEKVEKRGDEPPESRINQQYDGDFHDAGHGDREEPEGNDEEEVVEAEILQKSPDGNDMLYLAIDLDGYIGLPKGMRKESAVMRLKESVAGIDTKDVVRFNFAVDILSWLSKATALVKEFEEQIRKENRQQDDLPNMTNNDQRRNWIGTYRSWPLWSENKETRERYYRYVFENGDAFIIKDIYSNRERYDWNKRKNVRKAEWIKKEGFIMKNGALEELNDCVTSETLMIDYLREMKKKG